MKKDLLKLILCFSLLVAANGTNAQSWSSTGNSGTVDGTNFIGTTDNVPFNIRVNNLQSGRIDPVKFNTFFGYKSGNLTTSGANNTGIGYNTLISNTTGTYNTGIGINSLISNTTGYDNTGIGVNTLLSNSTGYFNSAIGVNSLFSN